MIRFIPIQNYKSVVEYLRPIHRQCRVLGIKIGCVSIGKLCARIGINLHINAVFLLCQNVQSIHIYIPVNQDNLSSGPLNDRCD